MSDYEKLCNLAYNKIPDTEYYYEEIYEIQYKKNINPKSIITYEEANNFIKSLFPSLNESETEYISNVFQYVKQQLFYYISVQSLSVNLNNTEYKNNVETILSNNEIFFLFFPFCKNTKNFKKVNQIVDLFLIKDENDNLEFSNMFYSINDRNVLEYKLDNFKVKKFIADNVIILLKTLEHTICRLFVNWVNVFPTKLREIENEEYTMFFFDETYIFANTIDSYKTEKTKFQKSKFFINYQLIHNKIKNAEFSDLKEDDSYKCFFGNVFPIGIFYNSLNYFSHYGDNFFSNTENYNDFKKTFLNDKIKKYNWDSLTFKEQEDFYNLLNDTNNELQYKFILFFFHILSRSGTLSVCFYNKDLNNEIAEKNKLINSKVELQVSENNWYKYNKNTSYFITDSSYRSFNLYLTNILKVEDRGLFANENSDLIDNAVFEFDKYTDLNYVNEKRKDYLFVKWIYVTEETLLYAANILPQINIFNKFLNLRVMFVTGDTGTGKSTQFPIIALYALKAFDYNTKANIIDTQPRKNAVTGNSGAVSKFLGMFIPNSFSNRFVQYLTGDDSKHATNEESGTLKIKFVTDKILLNAIHNKILMLDNDMKNIYDIIIVDEVHEHNSNMDLIITLMRNILFINNSVRLFLISATIENDEKRYRNFFRYIEDIIKYPINRLYYTLNISLVNLDRRLNISNPNLVAHPIEEYFIDDKKVTSISSKIKLPSDVDMNNLQKDDFKKIEEKNNKNILKLLNYEAKKNRNNYFHFLVFKSGQQEIYDCIKYFFEKGLDEDFLPLPWVGSNDKELQKVLDDLSRTNIIGDLKFDRKEILTGEKINFFSGDKKYKHAVFIATNIVEASITITDLYCVIDEGIQKTNLYDYTTNSSDTIKTLISNQSRIQRRGRVGRLMSGKVYYLYREKDIVNNPVIYKLSYDNFSEEFYNLLIIEKKDNINFSIKFEQSPFALKYENYTKIKFNIDTEEFKFNYVEFLKTYYLTYYEIRRNLKFSNTYTDINNKTLQKIDLDVLYSFGGYDYNVINDEKFIFYLIHPEEKDIKRDMMENVINKSEVKVKNYIFYCSDKYDIFCLNFKLVDGHYDYMRTYISSVFDSIYVGIMTLMGYKNLEGMLEYILLFIILTTTIEEVENPKTNKIVKQIKLDDRAIDLLYYCYVYFEMNGNLSFDFKKKYFNIYKLEVLDDFHYIKEIMNKKYYQDYKERMNFPALKPKKEFVDVFIKNAKSMIYLYEEYYKLYLNEGIDLENLTFNEKLILCIHKNIVCTQFNTGTFRYPKKHNDLDIVNKKKEQNVYMFYDLIKPKTIKIFADYNNTILQYTGNKDFLNSKENNFFIYFATKEIKKEKFNIFVVGVLYKINFTDLKYLYIVLDRLKRFNDLGNNKFIFVSPFDYMLDFTLGIKNDGEKVAKYHELYNSLSNLCLKENKKYIT